MFPYCVDVEFLSMKDFQISKRSLYRLFSSSSSSCFFAALKECESSQCIRLKINTSVELWMLAVNRLLFICRLKIQPVKLIAINLLFCYVFFPFNHVVYLWVGGWGEGGGSFVLRQPRTLCVTAALPCGDPHPSHPPCV